MYTQEVGRKFLNLYNNKTGKNSSALEFFEEEFFPVMFESEDKKQLFQFIHNSAFTQPSYPKLAEKKGVKISEFRKQRFMQDLELIPSGEKSLSHSALVGSKSGSTYDVPSGQVSDIELEISKEEIINSWIGAAFGISVRGNYEIIIHDDELLWFQFQGWKYYRKFLVQTPKAKGRQLSQWNGHWLLYGTDHKNDLNRAFSEVISGIGIKNSKSKTFSIPSTEWTNLIFGISRLFNQEKKVLGYVYKFQSGQRLNRTLGFIHIRFHEIKRWYELFEYHLQKSSEFSTQGWRAIKEVYKSHYGFEMACLQGGIGIRSLKPKDLEKYTSGYWNKWASKVPKMNSSERKIQFLIHQTWLIAMLNKEEIQKVSKDLAGVLGEHSKSGERGKTGKHREVEELWKSKSLSHFVDNLTDIMKESDEKQVFIDVVDKLITELPSDRFRLFLTLTKFNYYSKN